MLIPIDKMLLYKISRSIDNFLLRIIELVSSDIREDYNTSRYKRMFFFSLHIAILFNNDRDILEFYNTFGSSYAC